MPFDYEEYQKKCNGLSTEQLHKEWENYTRQISGGATSTATSVMFSPLTGGISLIGLGLSAPRIHNARKKREIIEAGLQARGATHTTRKRDVIAPMAIAGTLGGLTLGLAGPGADMIAGEAVGKGAEYAVSHAALDATGAVLEHKHDEHSKKKADDKLTAQYQKFQQQYIQGPVQLQTIQSQPNSYQPVQQLPALNQHHPPAGAQQPVVIAIQSQPQLTSQNQNYVPVQTTYQSASYQQKFIPQPQSFTNQTSAQIPPIHRPQKYLYPIPPAVSQPGAYVFHDPSTAKTAGISGISLQFSGNGTIHASTSRCPSPLPVYSQSNSTALQLPQLSPSQSTQSVQPNQGSPLEITAQPAPESYFDDDPPPTAPTMEEEIEFLKGRLLQMEIEKREAAIEKKLEVNQSLAPQNPQSFSEGNRDVPTNDQTQGQVGKQGVLRTYDQGQTENPPAIIPPSSVQEQQPSIPSSASSPTPHSASPSTLHQQYISSQPTASNIQTQIYSPPPTAQFLAPYQPHYYPPPPASPSQVTPPLHQTQTYPVPPRSPQPPFQRQDSGYYSGPPTQVSSPLSTTSPHQQQHQPYQYLPHQNHQIISPQTTGYSTSTLTPQSTGFSSIASHSTGNTSVSQYRPTPMSSPPSYFPPQGSMPMGMSFLKGAAVVDTGSYQAVPVQGYGQGQAGQSFQGQPMGGFSYFPPPPPSPVPRGG